MAIHKPTRSPRRAQLPSKPRRLTKPDERLPVYENLFALNSDFDQVLTDLARLYELGAFPNDPEHIVSVIVKRTRAEANLDIAEFLQEREQDASAWYDRLHARWERKMKDPDDVLIEAKLLLEKRRAAAARKKSKRQRRSAGSKAV
jgi:hypothetical protein